MFVCRAINGGIAMLIVLYLVLIFTLCRLYAFYTARLSRADKKRLIVYSSILIAIIFFLFWVFDQWQFYHWKKGIPTGIEISKNIDVGAEYGLFGGCGFAVYELSQNMLNLINIRGINALSNAHNSEYDDFSEWQKTPIATVSPESNADFWEMGMSCGSPSMDNELQNEVQEALNNPNSFYSLASHAGIIIIPKLKLLVVSVWS